MNHYSAVFNENGHSLGIFKVETSNDKLEDKISSWSGAVNFSTFEKFKNGQIIYAVSVEMHGTHTQVYHLNTFNSKWFSSLASANYWAKSKVFERISKECIMRRPYLINEDFTHHNFEFEDFPFEAIVISTKGIYVGEASKSSFYINH